MYRVRADIVSGTKVFAGGKWLRCIGNKNVSVGEYVWTDGRCIYGNYQESQQPIVITAFENEGIPIYMLDWDFDKHQYVGNLYTYKKSLKKISEVPRGKSIISDDFFINDYKNGVWKPFSSSGRFGFSYDSYGVNIDKNNNVYEIGINETPTPHVDIKKNGKVITTFACSDITSAPFIENENVWAFIAHNHHSENISESVTRVYTDSKLVTSEGTFDFAEGIKCPLQDKFYYVINNVLTCPGTGAPLYMYISIFTPNNKLVIKETFHTGSYIAICQVGNGEFLLGIKIIFPRIYSFSNGVLYKNLAPSPRVIGSIDYEYWNDGSGAVLLIVPSGDKNPQELVNYFDNTPYINEGLYICTKNKLEKIAEGNCVNQRLRPMTKIKDWHKRIIMALDLYQS